MIMATENQNTSKITVDGITRATVKVNNYNDAERTRDISAEVEVSNGKSGNIQSGTVRKKDEQTQVATFNQYGGSQLNITFFSEQERAADTEAVSAFISEVKNHDYEF